MSDKPNGGLAFPQPVAISPSGDMVCAYQFPDGGGMTLRDFLVAHALYTVSQKTNGYDPAWLAQAAYAVADAMLAERNK